ncbi:MAG: hypothetical protein ACE5KV_07875, partial [Thermoplasmata archaeon]
QYVYELYDIPDEIRLSVLTLELVKKLHAPSADEMIQDPPDMREHIQGYDAAMSLALSKDYIDRRKMDTLKALRELAQNALDEAEEVTGSPDIEMRQDSLGVWIADKGRGLKAESLMMGTTNKACWMRGYYGEGLKLAVGFFTLKGRTVYAFTGNKVFKFIPVPRESQNPRLYAILGRSGREVGGTEFLVHGLRLNERFLSRLISFSNRELQGRKIAEVRTTTEECPHTKPSAIYEYPDLLYIRNMLVGNTSEVAKRRSLFSYDLWWFRLDVSRTLMTYSVPDLFKEAARIYEKSPEALRRLAKKLIETEMIKFLDGYEGKALSLDPVFGIFEGHLFIYAVPEGLLESALEILGLREKKEVMCLTTNLGETRKAVERGLLPLQLSEEVAQYIGNVPRYCALTTENGQT